ncbi:MAG: hypothetical protein M3P18_05360 [Actinomycetota bacterium]|nr:hypothetical protein [Actinomycetota bacterium]
MRVTGADLTPGRVAVVVKRATDTVLILRSDLVSHEVIEYLDQILKPY